MRNTRVLIPYLVMPSNMVAQRNIRQPDRVTNLSVCELSLALNCSEIAGGR